MPKLRWSTAAVGTIDKANEVEGLVMQQKQQMDDALKRMEGETEDADQ